MTLLEHYEIEREEGRAEGLAEGRAEGLAEGILGSITIMSEVGKSEEQMIEQLIKVYGISESDAKKYIEQHKIIVR